MVMNIASMLERFLVLNVSDQVFLKDSLYDFGDLADEQNDALAYDSPVIEKVIEDGGVDAFRTLTNFTPTEFDTIWGLVVATLFSRWHKGRERKSTTTPRDALVMTFVILKYYQTWEKHAMDFDVKAPTLDKIVLRVVKVVQPSSTSHSSRCQR
ncbi:hypothetical protein H257_18462 [Aphanomyces astaci]|uniref:Uncharacterized protein n=1 Tax=Aphanomyces astaci TaxID=112090 RepID=W4FCR4_APHAT|nr:hypothetical protein H257_18462 [Aphanomyces astaci]ETV64684.1 hypothetical protein H257_18462 [Aphanomyces astaci]|eukprot:XP_009845819.1 hypothetical protein H257_18462 [Aphanomyces astaci]